YVEQGGLADRPDELARFATSFLESIVAQQFLFVAVVTPALVAGSITEEKSRGTLEHLLTSQLGPLAIIVGKLLVRLIDVMVLTLVVLPMATFVAPYAGAGATFLLGQAIVTVFTAFGLSALSVLASVWSRQTRVAVLTVYVVVVAAAGIYRSRWLPLPAWTSWFDPIWILTPARDGSPVGEVVAPLVHGGCGRAGVGN